VKNGIELSSIEHRGRKQSLPFLAFALALVLSLSGCVSPENRLAQIIKEFEATISDDDLVKARELYEEAYSLMPDSEEVKPLGQTLVNLELSKEAFEAAEISANNGDHLEAAELYLAVNKGDTLRLEDASTKLVNTVRLLIQEALEDKPLITQKRVLEFARELSVSRPELLAPIQSEKTELADAYLEAVISAVGDDLDEGRFDDAKYTLNSALQVLPKVESLRELSDTIDSSIERQKRAALSAMYKKTDTFEGIDWYYDRATYSSYAGNKFFLYIGKRGSGKPWLRLQMMYAGSDWIFWETLTVSVDGEKFSFNPGYYEVERDNYTTVWEWYDTPPDSGDIGMIEKIISSRNTTLRFEGQTYRADRVLSSAQKRAFKNVLGAYKALGG